MTNSLIGRSNYSRLNRLIINSKVVIDKISDDETLSGNSDSTLVTERAISGYINQKLGQMTYILNEGDYIDYGIVYGKSNTDSDKTNFFIGNLSDSKEYTLLVNGMFQIKNGIDLYNYVGGNITTNIITSPTDKLVVEVNEDPLWVNDRLDSKYVNEVSYTYTSGVVADFDQQLCTYQTTNEFGLCYVDNANSKIIFQERGSSVDNVGETIERGTMNNGDTIEITPVYWSFASTESESITTYERTPVKSIVAPLTPDNGDMWFDQSTGYWNTYNSTTTLWELSNLVHTGFVFVKSTGIFGFKSNNMITPLKEYNNVSLYRQSTYEIASEQYNVVLSTFNNIFEDNNNKIIWNIYDHMETGFVATPYTPYYLYLSSKGQPMVSPEYPTINDVTQRVLHPYNHFVCVGMVYTDSIGNLLTPFDYNGGMGEDIIYADAGEYVWSALPNKDETITVFACGAGGNGCNGVSNTSGNSGENAIFGQYLQANGGAGAIFDGLTGTGGAGGTVYDADISYVGEDGEDTGVVAGAGGSTTFTDFIVKAQTITQGFGGAGDTDGTMYGGAGGGTVALQGFVEGAGGGAGGAGFKDILNPEPSIVVVPARPNSTSPANQGARGAQGIVTIQYN